MKLLNYSVVNYKSVKNVTIDLDDDQINTFIGVNDSGKTTILKALGMFFDEKALVSFESDSTKKSVLSNTPLTNDGFKKMLIEKNLPEFSIYNEDMISVLCVFELDKTWTDEQMEEAGLSTHLQYILQDHKAGDTLTVMRTFSPDSAKNGCFIVCEDTKDPMCLWSLTQPNIKSKQSEMGIKDSEIENKNDAGQPKNIERIIAIYKKSETKPSWATFDFKKDKAIFPALRHLDWKISSDELNTIAGDVISPVVSRLLKPMQDEVNRGREQINIEANKELEAIYTKYAGSLPASILGINANVNINLQQAITELFVEKINADKKIHIDEQGDGIRRQIGLGLIRALAQESVDEKDVYKKYIWCLDEPETHLFPQAQRDLVSSLATMASKHFQVLVSTHSTLFVDKSNISNIKQVVLESAYTAIKYTSETDDIFSTLGVRNSDFLFYDRFIAVEGPTEFHLFDHLYTLLYENNMTDDGIQLINLQGKSNSGNQERLLGEIFKDFKKSDDLTISMLDKDTARTGASVSLIGETADFEDSVSDSVWIKAIKAYCGVDITPAEMTAFRGTISITDPNKKLHALLQAHVASKIDPTKQEYLPSKGESLANLLKVHITDKSDVHDSIKAGFELARKDLTK